MTGGIMWSPKGYIKDNDYKSVMSEFGRKGGLAKAEPYKPIIKKVINLYVNHLELNQEEIAEICGVSQSFVSKHTRGLKRLRKGKTLDPQTLNFLEILRKKEMIEMAFLDAVIQDDQEAIEEEFKL